MRRLQMSVVGLLAAGALAFSAPAAFAEPSEQASCVAQFVLGPPGPPGLFQSEAHLPRFGQNVSFVAHIPSEECLV